MDPQKAGANFQTNFIIDVSPYHGDFDLVQDEEDTIVISNLGYSPIRSTSTPEI